jgi:hypothetical protein
MDDAALPIIRAGNGGELGSTFAGLWREDDLLVVAVTSQPAAMLDRLAQMAPEARVTVVLYEHSHAELERLFEEVIAEDERLSAQAAAIGIVETENCVVVGLPDLTTAPARALIARFEGRPVRFEEEEVYAASRMASSSRSIESRSSAELSTRRTSAGVIPTRSAVSRNGVGEPPPLMP